MYQITINNLVVEGIHGVTKKEKDSPQRFEIDINITSDYLPADDMLGECVNDSIDAVDYRIVRDLVVRIVRDCNFNLLETLAHTIAEEILCWAGGRSVTVGIRKLDIWKNAVPGVIVTEERMRHGLDLYNINIDKIIDELCEYGGVSFPVIPSWRIGDLVKEAYSYEYHRQPEVLSGGKVREQLSSVREFSENSLFHKLKDDFTELLLRKLSTLKTKDIFLDHIAFDDMSLQKYEKDSLGITPHKDGKSRINIVCVFNLVGKAEFALCDDRDGSNPRFLHTTPGNVILLRAPGFFHSTFQPFHFVRNIAEERIVFGLRQGAQPKEGAR